MKVKLLKRFINGNKSVDIWQDCTLCLLPYIDINFIKCNRRWNLLGCRVGWLFWSVRYFADFKPCGYIENNVRVSK